MPKNIKRSLPAKPDDRRRKLEHIRREFQNATEENRIRYKYEDSLRVGMEFVEMRNSEKKRHTPLPALIAQRGPLRLA